MARVTVEDCLDQVKSRFALVHLAVRRVMQARKGYPVFVEAPKNKEVVRALREIAAGHVTIENIRELEALPEYLEQEEVQAEPSEAAVAEPQEEVPESPAESDVSEPEPEST